MKIGKIIKCLSNSVGSITKPHCTQRHRTTQLPAINILVTSATTPTFSALLWAWSNPCPWAHVPGGLLSFSHSFHTCAVPVVVANLHQTALSSSSPMLLVCLVAGLTDLMVKSLWLLPSPQTSDEFPCRHTQPPSGILKGQMPSHTEKAGLGLGEEKHGTSLPSLSHLHNHAKPAFSQPFQQSQEVIYSCPLQQLRTTSICSRICFHICMQKKKPALQTKYIQAEKQTALGSCCVLLWHMQELPYLPAPWEIKSYIWTNKCNPIKNK